MDSVGAVISDGSVTVASDSEALVSMGLVTSVSTEGAVVLFGSVPVVGAVVLLGSVPVVGSLVPAVSEEMVCAGGVVSSVAGRVVVLAGVVPFVLLNGGALYFTGLTES